MEIDGEEELMGELTTEEEEEINVFKMTPASPKVPNIRKIPKGDKLPYELEKKIGTG